MIPDFRGKFCVLYITIANVNLKHLSRLGANYGTAYLLLRVCLHRDFRLFRKYPA